MRRGGAGAQRAAVDRHFRFARRSQVSVVDDPVRARRRAGRPLFQTAIDHLCGGQARRDDAGPAYQRGRRACNGPFARRARCRARRNFDRAGVRRVAAGGRGRARHGRRRRAPGLGDRRRHPAPGRQRDRRGGRGRLRRGGRSIPAAATSAAAGSWSPISPTAIATCSSISARPRRRRRPRPCISTPRATPIQGASLDGWRAVATPGTVLGLDAALREYGTMPRARSWRRRSRWPATASSSAAPTPTFSRPSRRASKAIPKRRRSSCAPTARRSSPATAWSRAISPRRCRRSPTTAPDAFYRGAIAEKIDAAMRANGGMLTAADFAAYNIGEGAPLACAYRGFHFVSAPPPSSGGATLCEILNILEGYDLQAARLPFGRKRASDGRGDAPRLHRPQHLSRRSGVRAQSARPPAEQGLRGAHPRRDPARQGDAVAARFSPASRRTRRARRRIFR